ncbi:unnamed protein product [Haemonchus placei]|uniref:Uncharacterized protein n=1 Tax=Haemonchus placei TaxID=6290 RepID=A0A3P7UTK4_HAEPC|nr:unnamed protein product [Haemonchus placei]
MTYRGIFVTEKFPKKLDTWLKLSFMRSPFKDPFVKPFKFLFLKFI